MALLDAYELDKLEKSVREGDSVSVRNYLRKIRIADVPSRLALRVSRLARRVDFPQLGLMLLRSRVMDEYNREPRETAEYAVCLLKVGAVSEAISLIKTVDSNHAPESLIYQAFMLFSRWNYSEAIPILEKYVAHSALGPYDRLVGQLNLAAALVSVEKFDRAFVELNAIGEAAIRGGHQLILGNASELMAQAHILSGNLSSAEDCLNKSQEALQKAAPRYQLYIRKWRWIGRLMKDAGDRQALENLAQVRREALQINEWETVRECDFYLSKFKKDAEGLLYTYFGTPFNEYRAKMLRRCSDWIQIPAYYHWGAKDSKRHVDLETGLDEKGSLVFKKSQNLHRLFILLTKDFYRPSGIGHLFSQLFESEKFNPFTSPHRIHELMRRLRNHLAKKDLGLKIAVDRFGYRLIPGQFSIKIPRDATSLGDLRTLIESQFSQGPFKLNDLVERTKLPHTTVYRELMSLISDGVVEKTGSGKNTAYVYSKAALKSA